MRITNNQGILIYHPQTQRNYSKYQEITEQRQQQFSQQLQQGKVCVVELGCNNGKFCLDLARPDSKLVIGIEKDFATMQSTIIGEEYAHRKNCLIINGDYELDDFSWLRGKVSQHFLIMPYPHHDYSAEIGIWISTATANGQFHLRTEVPNQIERFTHALDLLQVGYELIPFNEEAANIPSYYSNLYQSVGAKIYACGIRLKND